MSLEKDNPSDQDKMRQLFEQKKTETAERLLLAFGFLEREEIALDDFVMLLITAELTTQYPTLSHEDIGAQWHKLIPPDHFRRLDLYTKNILADLVEQGRLTFRNDAKSRTVWFSRPKPPKPRS